MPWIFSFGIDPNQISQYLDYALYGIIGLVALGFVFGFLRGVWREGFRLLFVGGLVIASILFTRQAVDFFMDFNIASLAANAGYSSIALNLNNTPIIVAVTTPYATIYELLEQSLLAFGIFITPGIANLIIGLTLVILRYLVFIFLAIIILFLGDTIAAILYFIPFRFVIPRYLRKKVKLRLLGGFAGALKMVLVLTMFLSPFTSLVNTITGSFKDFDERYGNQLDAELYQRIMAFVNAYNDSTFAQTLFSWSLTENGLSIDTALMDYVTGQDIEQYRLTLANELSSFVDIAATFIGSGAIDSSFASIDTSLLLTEDVVTNLVASLTGSVLIMRILPIAVTIGLNLEAVSAYVDPTLISLDDLVWEAELNYIGDILKGVIRSGVLTPILAGNNDTNTIISSLFSPEAKPEINLILETIDSSPFLSQIIPAVLFQLVQEELINGVPTGSIGLSTFLPNSWVDYQSIAFGNELNIIYNLVYGLNAGIDGFFDYLIPTESAGSTPLGRKFVDDPNPSINLVDLLKENFPLVVEILIGETNTTGLPINNDPVTGKGINQVSLFDSDLVMNGIPSIVENLLLPTLTDIAGPSFDDSELTSLIASFNTGTKGNIRNNYKGEFAGIFSILSAVLANDALVNLLQPEEGESLDILALLQDGDFRKGLKQDFIPTLDRSQIILTIVPGILEATLTGAGFDDFLELISLSTADLNFEFSSLSRELIIIVDMMGYAFSVLDASNDLLNQFPLVAYDLIGLLDNIYQSDIINRNPITNNKTTNYNQIIKGIFTLVDGIGIEETDIDTGIQRVVPIGQENGWTTTYIDTNNNDKLDENDTFNFLGENFHLINFLKTTLDSGLLDISGDIFTALNDLTIGTEDIDDPNVAILYKIFAYADRSEIIAASFGGILDNLFGTTGGLLDNEMGTTFRNITSWTEEGSNLIFLVKQLTNFDDGLENIDFLNSDVAMVEELLQGLAASQIFVKPNGDYVFPEFLLKQLTGITSLSTYFLDPNPYQASFDGDPTDPYTIVRNDFNAISNQVITRHNWFGTKTLITNLSGEPVFNLNGDLQYEYVGGELENIVGFIAELQSISIEDLTGGPGIQGETIRNVLLSLNQAPSLRVLIYNVYDTIFSGTNFDIGSLSLSDTNTFAFLQINQAQRALEIEATANLIDTISEMGLDSGNFDISNFDTDTILTVGELLTILHDAKLFNTFKIGNSRTTGDLTVFEQVYEFLLTTSTIDTFIYDEILTPIQRKQLLYEDLVALDNNFADGTSDEWNGSDGEIQRFVDIMVAFVNTDIDFANFDGETIGDLLNTDEGLASLENLLLALNASSIVYPAIPNLFSTILNAGAIGDLDVDLSLANTRYRGNRNDPNNPLPGDQYLPYENDEISNLLALFIDVKEVGTKSYTNLNLISNDEIDEMQSLLEAVHDSNVFHLQGPSTGLATDLTVFEQMVVMMMNQTRVSDLIFDLNNPNPAYIGQFATKEGKARFLVLNFATLFPVNNVANFTSSWLNSETSTGELTRFFTIFKELKANLPGVGNLDGIDVANIPPAAISRIMSALNYSSLGSDAVPDLVKEAFGFISFATYTEGNENYYLTPRDYILTDLNQMDYSGVSPVIVQVGVIAQALNNFYNNNTNTYLNLGTNFNMKNYLASGKSTFEILDLLARSNLFGNLASQINNPSASQLGLRATSLSFKTRALTFYNLLGGSGVTKYFNYLNSTTDEKEKKVARVEDIFSGDFDTLFEANRLDQFIGVLTDFTTFTDASDLSDNPEAMRSLIELTYEAENKIVIDRAYLVSELSAGFFTDIFNEEYDNVVDPNAPFIGDTSNLNKRLNFYDGDPLNGIENDFLTLNPYEADGLEGSLRYLNVIAEISDDYIDSNFDPNFDPGETRTNLMLASMVQMGSLVRNQVTGTASFGPSHGVDAYDFSNWDINGNSKIAKLFYASQVVSAPGFDFFSQLVTAKAFVLDPLFPVVLSITPYATNFVFEIEGAKINYVFGQEENG